MIKRIGGNFGDRPAKVAVAGIAGVLAAASWPPAGAWAQTGLESGSVVRPNSIGIGLALPPSIGFTYSRLIGQGVRLRASFFGVPSFNSPGSALVVAGAGLQRDLTIWGALSTYSFAGGMFRHVSNVDIYSVEPGFGLRWGPAVVEVGTSFWESFRQGSSNPTKPIYYIEWGLSATVGLGLLWDF